MLWVLASVWEAALKALCSLQAQERGNAPAVCPPAHPPTLSLLALLWCHSATAVPAQPTPPHDLGALLLCSSSSPVGPGRASQLALALHGGGAAPGVPHPQNTQPEFQPSPFHTHSQFNLALSAA